MFKCAFKLVLYFDISNMFTVPPTSTELENSFWEILENKEYVEGA